MLFKFYTPQQDQYARGVLKKFPITLLLFCSILYLISPSLQYFIGSTGHNDQRLIELCVLAITTLFLIIVRFKPLFYFFSITSQKIYFICIALFVYVLCSGIWVQEILRSYQEFGLYVGLLLLGVVVAVEFSNFSVDFRVKLILLLSILISVLLLVKVLVQYLAALSYPIDLVSAPYIYGFSNPRSVNHIQAYLLPLLVSAMFLMPKNLLAQSLIWVLLTLSWCLVFYLKGRGVFISIFLSFLFFLIFSHHHRSILLLRLVVPCVLGYFFYWCLYVYIPYEFLSIEGSSYLESFSRGDSGRFELWAVSWASFINNPLFGIGGLHFSLLSEDVVFNSAHNQLLNLLVEYGLFVGLAFIYFSFFIFRLSVQLLRSQDIKYLGTVFSIFSALIYSNFTGILLSPLGQLFFVVFFGFLLSVYIDNQEVKEGVVVCDFRFKILMTLSFGFVLLCLLASFSDIWFYGDVIRECETTCYPRFWLNGNFWDYQQAL